MVSRHFPPGHKLHPIFNRSTMKISYSCMPNMAARIKAHNNWIINGGSGAREEPANCTCRDPNACPLSGGCETRNVVYQATVTTGDEEKTYVGLTSTSFKTRYNQHISDMNLRNSSQKTSLSQFIWKLKDSKKPYSIKWKILRHAQPYSPRSKRCNLCLWEKVFIITANKQTSLNSRNELVSKCLHRKKCLLSEFG